MQNSNGERLEVTVEVAGGGNNFLVHVVNPKNVADYYKAKEAVENLFTTRALPNDESNMPIEQTEAYAIIMDCVQGVDFDESARRIIRYATERRLAILPAANPTDVVVKGL